MKAEHARYKKALETLCDRYPECAEAFKVADRALNPPSVTLTDLQAALRNAQGSSGDYVALLLNGDGSGNFRLGPCETRGADFNTLQQALDMLLSGESLTYEN